MKRLSVRLVVAQVSAGVLGALVTLALAYLLVPRAAGERLLAVAVSAGAAVMVATIIALLRWVSAPIRAWAASTRQLTPADPSHRVDPALSPELAEVASTINDLAEELAAGDRRRVRLIAQVTTEMRAPLAGLTERLDHLEVGADEQVAHAVRRLQRLVTDLSTLSRVEEGALDLRLTEVDLAELINRSVQRFQPDFADAGVRLHALASGRIAVRADAQRLDEVLANLLENALRATRQQPAGEVLVGLARTHDNARPVVRLTVTDNGTGLTEDEVGRVFDRFYRTEPALATDGTGIGLTVAREIVRAHGGELTANSPGRGKGATLTLTLPTES